MLSTIRRIFIYAIATLSLLVTVLTVRPIAAYAATNPLYIRTVLTEPVTQVNQLPKVVQTYGNSGTNPLVDVEAYCEYGQLSPQWAIDLNFDVIDRPQRIIPGQNTNRETAIRTIAPGQVEVLCQVNGRDAVTGEKFTAFSKPLTLTVKAS